MDSFQKNSLLLDPFQKKMNLLVKWRSILAGWQLGTRSIDDPENQAVRDQREMLLLIRVELNAVIGVLFRNGIITVPEFKAECMSEADSLMLSLEKRFPGAKAIEDGMSIDPVLAEPWLSKFRQ